MARVAYGRSTTRVNTTSHPDDETSPVGTTEWNLDPEASGLLGFTKITATLDASDVLSTKDDSATFTNESGTSQAKQSTLIEVECNGTDVTGAVVKISLTDTNINDVVYLFKGTDGDTVTVTSHTGSFSANGQIKSLDGNSITLNDTGKPVSLMRRGNYWFEFGGGGGIAAGAVDTTELAAGAVTSAKIEDGAIMNVDINTNAVIANTKIAGLGTMSTQAANSVNIDGGAIDSTPIGATTPSTIAATTISASGAITGDVTGNADSATALATGRTIGSTGDITWTSGIFTGAANATGLAAITADVIVNADVKTDAEIAYSKLDLAGEILNTDLAGNIANTKLADNPLVYTNMVTPTADVPFGSQKITGLGDGTADSDAATKGQLNTAVASNITLKGGYNASTDDPHLDSGTRVTIAAGDHYVVTDAGTFYSEVLQAGDSLISTVASPTAFAQWIITNNNVVTPIVTANIANDAVTTVKIEDDAVTNDKIVGSIAQSKITSLTNDLGLKAALISPTFTGTVTADNLTATGTLTATLTGTATGLSAPLAVGSGGTTLTGYTAGDILYASSTTALAKLAKGTTEQTLKMNTAATAPEWVTVSAGGASTLVHQYTNTPLTAYAGTTDTTPTRYTSSGTGIREIYIKRIDASNEGVFTTIFKNGSTTEVQIA